MAEIVNYEGTGFYAAVAADLINILLGRAAELTEGAQETLADAIADIKSNKAVKPLATPYSFVPSPAEPNVNIPQQAPNVELVQFQSTYNNLMEAVITKANDFFNTYFPNETQHLAEVDAWLSSAIQGSVGIDVGIEAQIYQRDKDRIENEYQKSLVEAEHIWASRGFGMPQGMLAGVQFNLRQSADAKLAESSRAVAIKQVEIRLENAKFAVQTAVTKRTAAIQATVQYIASLLQGYSSANQFAVLQNDAQSKLIAAASDFYKARISVEELKFKSTVSTAEFNDKAAERYQQQVLSFAQLAANAAMEGAKTLATSSASALNALHTGASINASSGSNTSNSTSYNENVSV